MIKPHEAVGQFLSTYNLLAVSNGLPVRSVREFIDYARQNPGKLLNASSGNGTTGHLGGELFKIMTGTSSFPRARRGRSC